MILFLKKLVQVTDPGVNTPGSDEERLEQHELTDNIPLTPHDSSLPGCYTPGSDEERLEQHELTDNIPLTPHDSSLPGCYTPDEGRLQQEKLTDIVTALSQKVEGLESDPKKTKKLYAIDFKKLID
ncbi:hypothetical protein Tco_0243921, partial [Tanacetum coccineum]